MATTACLPPPVFSPSILQQPSTSRSPPRRIRFAPLPDPHRSVLVTDAGDELPLPQFSPSSHFPAVPTPSPSTPPRSDYFAGFDAASSCSSSSDSRLNSDSQELSASSSVSSISAAAPTPPSAPSENLPTKSTSPPLGPCPPPNKKSFSFFRSLKRSSGSSSPSSSNSLTPVASVDRTPNASTTFPRRNFSAEEILTLGTINLFRASSKDISEGDAPPSAWSLTRWSSASSAKDPYVGSPLYRVSSAQSTRSTQSYQSTSTLKPKAKVPKRGSSLRPPSRKGTRMLNGRVYGSKPSDKNPFANARDEEPTFVEWGYGGMGSVKGATSAGAHDRWGRLQNSQPQQEEDDGSGMAWIRKRREQKEQERKEREEHEKQSQTVTAATQADANPASPASSSSSSAPSSSASPSAMTSPTSSQSTPATDDEHVMTAINIPAPHHYVRYPHSRSASKDGVVACDLRETKIIENESEGSRSSTSDSDSDEEPEDDSSSCGDDDEEEEEEERKTALGAGVEKISRHH